MQTTDPKKKQQLFITNRMKKATLYYDGLIYAKKYRRSLSNQKVLNFVRMKFTTNSSGKVKTNDLMLETKETNDFNALQMCVCISIFTKPYDQHQKLKQRH